MNTFMFLVYGIGYAVLILFIVGFVILLKKMNKLIKLLEKVIEKKND